MVFGPLPNLSDTAALSESSFQIPNALGSTSQLLLGDDCDDFLAGMDTTLSTPAPSTSTKLRSIDHNPLTLAELTPRSRQTKAQTLRYTSSSRKPTIPSLLKRTVARDLSTAMDDTLSAFRHPPDYSFQIPKIGGDVTQLLLAEDDLELLSKGSDCSFPNVADSTVQLNEDLTLSQLTPECMPDLSNSTSTQATSAGSSQSSAGVVFSVLKAQVESLDDNVDQSACSVDRETPSLPVEASPDALFAHSHDTPSDQNTQHTDEFTTNRETCVNHPVVPPCAVDRRKSTGKKTVVASGVVKRSKPSIPISTNALRSKAIGKHRAPTRSSPRLQGPCPELNNATMTAQTLGHASYKTTTTGSLGRAARNIASLTDAEALCATVPKEIHVDQPDNPTSEMKSVCTTSATLHSARDVESAVPSNPKNHVSGQPLNSNTEFKTHRQISPSGIGALTTAEPAAVVAVHDAHDAQSASMGLVECDLDMPGIASTNPSTVPPSPMRRSSKRAAPDDAPDDDVPTQSKRGRLSQSAAEPTATSFLNNSGSGSTLASKATAVRPPRAKNAVHFPRPGTAASKFGPSVSRTASTARTVRKPSVASTVNTGEPTERTSRTGQLTASSTSVGDEPGRLRSVAPVTGSTSRSAVSKTANQHEPAVRQNLCVGGSTGSGSVDDEHGHTSRAGSSQAHAKLAVSLPPGKATVPIEFRFHSEARIEARKRPEFATSGSLARRTHDAAALGIPDFKALHDAEEQRLASRKDHIVPVLPGHVELCTEARAHEREKFDEARRAREAEAERAMEEKRRLEAIEEEREVKELRRRAVPKANEVPEWYAHAAKRR